MTTKTKKRTTTRPDRYEPYPIELHQGMTREEIYAAYQMSCPPRVATLRDPTRKTYGTAVARISAQLGMPMMPHQRYSVDVAGEVDPDTRELVYRDVTELMPRQSGKTSIILSVKSHRALHFPAQVRRHAPQQVGRQRILYAAQKRIDARDKLIDDHLPVLNASPLASRFRARLAQGAEALLWDTGAIDGITSNTEDAAHGKTLDLGIEDEFFHAEDARLEAAFSPAMLTRWSPQHWRVSTEGTEKSLYLAAKVELGREIVAAGGRSSICYMEWSELDGARDAVETWLACMPALCPLETGPCVCGVDGTGRQRWRHTVRIPTIRAELAKATTEEDFDRAYLNRRRGSKAPPDPNLPTPVQWNAVVDTSQKRTPTVAFGIELHMQRLAAAIVAVWLNEDGVSRHMRVIEYRPGVDWVPGRAKELAERWDPIAWGMGLGGPCGTMLVPLEEVGIVQPDGDPQRGQLAVPNAREFAAGVGMVVDGIRHKTLWHEDQTALNSAFLDARTRPSGDAFTWARRAGGETTALVGGTVGLWALETRKHLANQVYDPSAFWV